MTKLMIHKSQELIINQHFIFACPHIKPTIKHKLSSLVKRDKIPLLSNIELSPLANIHRQIISPCNIQRQIISPGQHSKTNYFPLPTFKDKLSPLAYIQIQIISTCQHSKTNYLPLPTIKDKLSPLAKIQRQFTQLANIWTKITIYLPSPILKEVASIDEIQTQNISFIKFKHQ